MTDFDPAVFGAANVRVGTAERERAAAALGEHFAAGRLDIDEFDERVGRAYAAKTAGELVVLFTDLPRPVAAKASRAQPRTLLPVAVIAVLLFATAVVVATHIVPFLVFPLLFFLFIRGHHGFRHGRARRRYQM